MKLEISAIYNGWVEPPERFIILTFGDKNEQHVCVYLTKSNAEELVDALNLYLDSLL